MGGVIPMLRRCSKDDVQPRREDISAGAGEGEAGKAGEAGTRVTRAEALRIARETLERAERERNEPEGECAEPLPNLGWQLACEREGSAELAEQVPLTAEKLAAIEERLRRRAVLHSVMGGHDAGLKDTAVLLAEVRRTQQEMSTEIFDLRQRAEKAEQERDEAQVLLARAWNLLLNDERALERDSEVRAFLADPTGQAAAERWRNLEVLAVVARKHLYDDSNKTWSEFSEALDALDQRKEQGE